MTREISKVSPLLWLLCGCGEV